MKHLVFGIVLLSAVACASLPGSPFGSFGPAPDMRRLASGTECDPGWATAIPRDTLFFYFPDVGIARTEMEALDGAWERTALAYARRVSAIASENVEYITRRGSRAAADTVITRAFLSRSMASGLEQVAQSKACAVPEGYRVWRLYRVSAELTLRRLIDADPLARGIDFSREIRGLGARR